MVEKGIEAGEAIMVSAIDTSPDVGTAIEAMEARLAHSGIVLNVPPPKVARKDMVAGKLLRLGMMVNVGITHAIDSGKATEKSIGKHVSSAPTEALVPGNIVALYSDHHGKFLRIKDGKADGGGGPRDINQLPYEWDSERFLVVDAGEDSIAFFSPSHRVFLVSRGGNLLGDGHPITNLDDRPCANESFQVCDGTRFNQDRIQLKCGFDSDKVRFFRVVQVEGFGPVKSE